MVLVDDPKATPEFYVKVVDILINQYKSIVENFRMWVLGGVLVLASFTLVAYFLQSPNIALNKTCLN